MNGVTPISVEQADEDVQKMIDSEKIYVWKNEKNKIVCMVNYSVVDGQAKLSHVYTPIEERAKGYASNLIYAVTNDLDRANSSIRISLSHLTTKEEINYFIDKFKICYNELINLR